MYIKIYFILLSFLFLNFSSSADEKSEYAAKIESDYYVSELDAIIDDAVFNLTGTSYTDGQDFTAKFFDEHINPSELIGLRKQKATHLSKWLYVFPFLTTTLFSSAVFAENTGTTSTNVIKSFMVGGMFLQQQLFIYGSNYLYNASFKKYQKNILEQEFILLLRQSKSVLNNWGKKPIAAHPDKSKALLKHLHHHRTKETSAFHQEVEHLVWYSNELDDFITWNRILSTYIKVWLIQSSIDLIAEALKLEPPISEDFNTCFTAMRQLNSQRIKNSKGDGDIGGMKSSL